MLYFENYIHTPSFSSLIVWMCASIFIRFFCGGLESRMRGIKQPVLSRTWDSRTRTRTRTWKLVLEDNDFARGQQNCKHRVSNKRPRLPEVELSETQSTSHTLHTSHTDSLLSPRKFPRLELPRTRTRTSTRTWKLVIKDPRGQGLSSRTTTLKTAGMKTKLVMK